MQVVSVKNLSDKESTIRLNLLLYAEALKPDAGKPRILFNKGSDESPVASEINCTTPVSMDKDKKSTKSVRFDEESKRQTFDIEALEESKESEKNEKLSE